MTSSTCPSFGSAITELNPPHFKIDHDSRLIRHWWVYCRFKINIHETVFCTSDEHARISIDPTLNAGRLRQVLNGAYWSAIRTLLSIKQALSSTNCFYF